MKSIPINLKTRNKIDAHLDCIDELIIKLDLPRSAKQSLSKYTYEFYAALEAAVDQHTPKEE